MPVTAKLSRQFCDRFGDEIANELVEWFNAVDSTYRADLWELNELNFARFDAKLEQRIQGLASEMQVGFARFETKFAALRSDLLRWMFLFWVTTLAALVGLARIHP